jgi:hypothetical protein
MQDARVVGEDDVALRAIAKEADERGMLALDNLDDATFRATIRAAAFDAAEDAIAVHGVAQVVASNEKVAVDSPDGRIGDEKAVTLAVRNNSAGNEIGVVAAFRWRRGSWLLIF